MKKIKKETSVKERVDKFISENTNYSRSLIVKMIEEGLILVNDKKVKPSFLLKENDEISILGELQQEMNVEEENIPLDIVFENDEVIVVNKKSGMVVHPGSGNKNGTLVNALLYHTKNLSDNNGVIRPGIVHRIDKDTSGLLLIAKTNKVHELLAQDFKEKKVKRKYIALVKGVLKHNHITIDAPIKRDENDRKKMAVREGGKNAITHVLVLKRYKDYTLVECVLDTGRTHQIRVHMAYIGYPIYNDPVYQKKKTTPFGQFLHSSELEFVDPITKEAFHFKAPLPKEFQDFLDTLE